MLEPSLCQHPRHERADSAAELLLFLLITSMKLPACELRPHTSCFQVLLQKWQDVWNKCLENKLHSIGTAQRSKFVCSHETVILNRLRVGHCRMTHSYLLSGDDQATCGPCGLTVKHILVECPGLQDIRLIFFC